MKYSFISANQGITSIELHPSGEDSNVVINTEYDSVEVLLADIDNLVTCLQAAKAELETYLK